MADKNTLFGENITAAYDPKTARGNVISGISEYMKPQLQKARGSLTQRGFGRYHAPTIEGQVYNPMMQAGAESVRRGLTDLHYKDESLKLQKAASARADMRAGQYYDLSEGQIKQNAGKMNGGKVLCTELYRQGLLPLSHIKADLKYLKLYVDKETHDNYLRWAVPFTKIMQRSKLVTYIIWLPVLCWSEYMKCTVYKKRLGIRAMIGFVWQISATQFGKWYKTRLVKELV